MSVETGQVHYSGVSKKASSMAGSDSVNHCCVKSTRSIVAKEKGGYRYGLLCSKG